MTVTSNIKWKNLLINITIPLTTGIISALISKKGFEQYSSIAKPALSPPAWLFPVVWSLLYILMGISSYLISEIKSNESRQALIVYAFQLFVNFMWPIFFFVLKAYLFSFVWLILLWSFTVAMTILFHRINKTAGLLQLPYILWLTFAAYLNLMVYIMN